MSNSQRVQRGGDATINGLKPPFRPTIVSATWLNAVDHHNGLKGFSWRKLDQGYARELRENQFGHLGESTPYRWNRTITTEPAQANDLTLGSHNPENKLVAKRGHKVVWTFLGSGRMGRPPLVIDDKALIAYHGGS